VKETDKRPAEAVLVALYNLSAVWVHISGADADRPVSWWAWRIGSRAFQFGLLSVVIGMPFSVLAWALGICFLDFPRLWAYSFIILWSAQLLMMAVKLGRVWRANLRM
jgi:hypothetical protein